MDQSLTERFWAKVDRRGPDDCWPWTGYKNPRGYGRYYQPRRRQVVPATHIAWEIANDLPFPKGKSACHSCDNPPCVNPAHIWPGTAKQNAHDALRKGRLGSVPLDTKLGRRVGVRRRPGSGVYGHGKLCRACGHLRTDDYLTALGKYQCRPCLAARYARAWAKRRARSQAARQAGAVS